MVNEFRANCKAVLMKAKLVSDTISLFIGRPGGLHCGLRKWQTAKKIEKQKFIEFWDIDFIFSFFLIKNKLLQSVIVAFVRL